jgi:hypothetical protein
MCCKSKLLPPFGLKTLCGHIIHMHVLAVFLKIISPWLDDVIFTSLKETFLF